MYGGLRVIKCDKCDRDISVNNFMRHHNTCTGKKTKKIRGIDYDPNHGFTDGTRKQWNSGVRTKPDTRDPRYVGKIGGYRENAGRSKKYRVLDTYGTETVLQSSYELICSQILNTLNIAWVRPKYLKYDNRKYFADFYLTEYDIYLDPKNNYKAKLDFDKIEKVIQQNNVRVYVLRKEHLTEEYIKMLVSPNGAGLA